MSDPESPVDRRRAIAAVALAALGLAGDGPAGTGVPDWLERADSIELISLDPRDRPAGVADAFGGWKVLGRTTLARAEGRRAIVASLREGFAGAGDGSGCFEPRHGLRATRGGQAVEFVICFSCGWVEAREGGGTAWVRISPAPKPTFNAALRAAGVPLAQDVEGP